VDLPFAHRRTSTPSAWEAGNFVAGSGADLGEWRHGGHVGRDSAVIPRCSPLDLVRLWCGAASLGCLQDSALDGSAGAQ
jgi:hypothetical protein